MQNENFAPELLRALRAKLNLSQEQLADRLGVSFATVNRWEAGKARPQRTQQDAIDRLMQEAGMDGSEPVLLDMPAAPARRRRGTARSAVLGTKSMEQMLWDAACSIRGEKDAPKFKDYLLPLLFLKRLSDVFDDEIARLTEEYRDRDLALEVAEGDHSVVRFYVPREARWAAVSGREPFAWPEGKAPKSLGEHLTLATRAVVRHNPDLAGVLDVVDFAAEHNGEREVSDAALKGVVETFSDPRYRLGLKDVEPDFLGRCYEYLLRKFAEGSGQSAGEFFTPREVGFLMARVLRPRPGEECHDYACGSAGLLIKLQLVCREVDPLSKVPLRLYGQERQRESYAVAWMNTIVHDMQADVQRGDSMRNPKFRNADGSLKRFDIVIANPMWNQPFDADVYDTDAFGRFKEQGGITAGKGDWAWLQHTLACLKGDGRAAVVLDTGAVTRGSGSKNEDRERNIRKWFVEQDVIEGVIQLPDNLFYNTTAAGVIVVLNKRKPKERQGKIVLLNAGRHVRKGSPKNYIPEEDIAKLAEAFVKAEPIGGLVKVITIDEATRSDFNLSPSRYVSHQGEHEYESISELLKELKQLDAEAAALSDNLRRLLDRVSNNGPV